MGFVARLCQPSTLRMLIWPEVSSAQNNMAAVFADGSTVHVLILRLNSSCSRSIAFVRRTNAAPLALRKTGEGEERIGRVRQEKVRRGQRPERHFCPHQPKQRGALGAAPMRIVHDRHKTYLTKLTSATSCIR